MDCQPWQPGAWYWPLMAEASWPRDRTCPMTLLGAPTRTRRRPHAAASAAGSGERSMRSFAYVGLCSFRTVADTRTRVSGPSLAQRSDASVRLCEVADMLDINLALHLIMRRTKQQTLHS